MEFTFIEDSALRNRQGIFADRRDAGRRLGRLIRDTLGEAAEPMVLAIPAGGVPVGLEVSRVLQTNLDLLVVRKLQIPGNTEAGFGAMTLDGVVFLNRELLSYLDLEQGQIEAEKARVMEELTARNDRFRQGRPFPDVEGREVILVDDGLASGFTMLAAAETVRRHKAASLSAAVPTAPLRSVEQVKGALDRLYCLNVVDRPGPFAVAGAYQRWHDLDHDEVLALLKSQGLEGTGG
ncbi:MAG: phosphoribosyltransferase [Desulfohalobiaceae bacterium]